MLYSVSKFITVLTVLLTSMAVIFVQAQNSKAYLFAVNAPGFVPYLYFDYANQTYVGLIPDFFADSAQQSEFKVNFVDSNQLRSEQFVIDGKLDFYLAHKGWLINPDKLIATRPLVQHLTYLYSLSPFPADFSVDKLKDARICTQQKFVYTGLTQALARADVKRVDSTSIQTIGSMLAKGRCDYAVLNNYNATKVFSDNEFCHLAIHQSPQATSKIELVIVMRPALEEVKQQLDKHLLAFEQIGAAQQSLLAHSPKPEFPKLVSCD
ncbi:substrate-binding periplasmic protein [Paraglaciecola aestuariivivens]